MDQHSVFLGGVHGLNNGFNGIIFNLDMVERVFGQIAVLGNNDCNRFANKAHPVNCQAPLIEWHTEDNQKRFGQFLDILTGQYRMNTGAFLGFRNIKRRNFSMGVG